MITTSVRPPAYEYVRQHGDLLRQFGADKVEATDAGTITLTYHNNSKAVNADALLKDEVQGARLVIDNQSLTTDAPTPNAYDMSDILKGVAGLDVSTLVPRGRGPSAIQINVTTADQDLARLVGDLVEPKPTDGVNVSVTYDNAAEQ